MPLKSFIEDLKLYKDIPSWLFFHLMAGIKNKTTTSTVVVQKTTTTRTIKSRISNKAEILIVNQIVTSDSQKQLVKDLKTDKSALRSQLQESQREASQLRAQLQESQRESTQLRVKQDKVEKSLTQLLKSQKSKKPKRL